MWFVCILCSSVLLLGLWLGNEVMLFYIVKWCRWIERVILNFCLVRKFVILSRVCFVVLLFEWFIIIFVVGEGVVVFGVLCFVLFCVVICWCCFVCLIFVVICIIIDFINLEESFCFLMVCCYFLIVVCSVWWFVLFRWWKLNFLIIVVKCCVIWLKNLCCGRLLCGFGVG